MKGVILVLDGELEGEYRIDEYHPKNINVIETYVVDEEKKRSQS